MSSRKNRLVLIFGAAILSAFSGAILADSHTLTAVKNWSTFKEAGRTGTPVMILKLPAARRSFMTELDLADDRLGNYDSTRYFQVQQRLHSKRRNKDAGGIRPLDGVWCVIRVRYRNHPVERAFRI